MPELNEGVNPVVPPTTEVVNEVETTEETSTTPEQSEPQSPNPEGVTEGEVDERGVPYKNRFMEAQRKLKTLESEYTGLRSELPNLIQEAVKSVVPVQQQPVYTKEELIRFKNSEIARADSDKVAWAEVELEKVRERENRAYFEGQRQAERKSMQEEQIKRDSLGYVMNNYGVMFNPDGSWNNNHPLTQKLARIYNSDETLKNHPRGLQVAADMALAEQVRETQPNLMKREQKLKRQVKKLENATRLEGSGQPVINQNENLAIKTAVQEHMTTGSKTSTQFLVKEMLKKAGNL